MEIISAEKEHIDSILRVTKSAFNLYKKRLGADINLKALEETYEDVLADIKNNYVFVAVMNSNVVGCIRLQKLFDEITYIYRFSVDPEIQNVGIGSELIRHAVIESERLGAKAITLHSNAKNSDLVRFYYGKGFYIHSTDLSRGYVRALFVKEIKSDFDLSPAYEK